MIKLSFIVPVYNVAPYLRKCVDSLLMQDYDDYEIILVDDGSTDGSGAICDEYARVNELEHERVRELENERISESGRSSIHVIHQPNGGLSVARNAGLKAAKGEYVCFADSDDYWEENVLGGLMAQVEREKLDVLRFNYRNVNEQYEEFYPNKAPKRDVDYSEEVTDGEMFLNERLGPACYSVMFVIKRSLLINELVNDRVSEPENDCLFTPGIYFEDVDWTPRMLLRAKKVASTPKVVYNYLWRAGSITLPIDNAKRKKVLEDKIKLIGGFKEQSQHVQNPVWFTWMTSFTAMSILGMISKMSSEEQKQYIDELKSLHIFPLSVKKEKMWKQRMKIYIANISPNIYCKLISLRK